MSIRYSERLAEAGIEPSVGSKGDSYDNALEWVAWLDPPLPDSKQLASTKPGAVQSCPPNYLSV